MRFSSSAPWAGLLIVLGLSTAQAAEFSSAIIIELDEAGQTGPGEVARIAQATLAGIALNCNVETRRTFDSQFFRGASLDLACVGDKLETPLASILAAVQSIPGIEKAWPVRQIENDHPLPVTDIPTLQRRAAAAMRPRKFPAKRHSPGVLSTLVQTGVDRLHAVSTTGKGVRVAVIDSGFNLESPALRGLNVGYAHDLTDGDADVSDGCTVHGTHVLGIVGANSGNGVQDPFGVLGVAPDATYELYRIQPCDRWWAETDDLISAFLEAAERGVDVITCSFGGGRGFAEDPWESVIGRVAGSGIYVSLVSGNGGPGPLSSSSPSGALDTAAVGSADNSVTPFYTWAANLTLGDESVAIRAMVGYPVDVTPGQELRLWAPLTTPPGPSSDCSPLPDVEIPKDLSNVAVLSRLDQCWTDINGTTLWPAQAFPAPYHIYYEVEDWTISRGPVFSGELPGGDTKAVFGVDHDIGLQILDSLASGRGASISIGGEATAEVENRPNNRTGGLASRFSGWGPTLDLRSSPMFLAPGGNILSTLPEFAGDYGVMGGTSMATPFAAGVAALVKQRRPSLSAAQIQAVLSSTAKPVNFHNDDYGLAPADFRRRDDLLAPVFQQGGGLLDAWAAVRTTTLLNASSLSFNDTAHRPTALAFTVRNDGRRKKSYTIGHIGAASGYVLASEGGYVFSGAEAFPAFADVAISPSSLNLGPGDEAVVTVSITSEPRLSGADARLSYFGGYVSIKSNGEALSLPYTGIGGRLADLPVVNRNSTFLAAVDAPTYVGHPAEAGRVFLCAYNATVPTGQAPALFLSEDGSPGLSPAIELHLTVPSRNLTITVVDDDDARTTRLVALQGPSTVGWSGPWLYLDGTDGNRTFVPAGTYRWRVTALRLSATGERPEDWETWESDEWVLKYTSDSILP